jgi:mRNA-degrading endonuclease RelE of RelBE toxin-antitoxin system
MSFLLLAVSVGALAAAFVWRTKSKRFEATALSLTQEAERAKQELAQAHASYDSLAAQVRPLAADLTQAKARLAAIRGLGEIEDGLAYATRLRELAERELQDAKTVRGDAEARALVLLQEAASERTRLSNEAEAQRAHLLAEAESQARQIAGRAYELAQKEGELRRIVQALENTVKGYGDEYLIPTSAVLDELEDRYGFSDVGQSLASARKRVADMIKSANAATCDYVEANRRETAIAFVLDAFNGKVDSILAAVKHDNFGKLNQRINDSAVLINRLGAAFRNARIERPFIEAQIEVLKWAVAAHELKRLEKEEQRALREQIREEEKARKEFEKALKEAARDEDVARKAVAKARADLERANEAERTVFEAKLAELSERLRAAEERGQRALSMAQQTRSGNVYVISNVGSFGQDVYKIGMTRRLEPEDRVKELGDASVPFSFDIHAMIRTDDAPSLERALHKRFLRDQVNKVNPRKEFFRVPLTAIKAEVERMNVEVAWTMSAACAEWRESQAIEQRWSKDANEYKRWSESQLREHERALLTEFDSEEALVPG